MTYHHYIRVHWVQTGPSEDSGHELKIGCLVLGRTLKVDSAHPWRADASSVTYDGQLVPIMCCDDEPSAIAFVEKNLGVALGKLLVDI